MKFIIIILAIIIIPIVSFGQVLLETIDGEEISLNPNGLSNSILIGNLNSTEQSIQFRTMFALPHRNGVLPNSFITLGLKGKPSDGIFTLFSGGNFNTSTNINLSFTKIHLFSNEDNLESKFTDFYSIKADYNVNKQTIFKTDTLFNKQINNVNFEGNGLSFTYNALISGKYLLTFIVAYSHKDNYSKLETVEVKDFKTIVDSLSGTTRQYGKVVNGKMGNYQEFDRFPLRLGYTYCPSESKEDKDKLKFGFTLYYSSEFGKNIPVHNIGALLFLTMQNDSGIRTPIIGLGLQANDLNDNMNKNNALTKRVSINLTTTFNIANL
ncbi:MAG TPA: hypothetical protein VIK14_09000 [Ignavibacteria bacterium]